MSDDASADRGRLQDNRRSWDERAGIHARSQFYAVDELVADRAAISSVTRRDFAVIGPHLAGGELAGRSLLHLQCHIGTDTLSWRRLGAGDVWGVDFSSSSLAVAQTIAERAGEDLVFVEADARFAAQAIDRQFDVVVTSIGTIVWLPALDDWARSIAALLASGGVFLIRDDHPLLGALHHESLTIVGDYLAGTEPESYDSETSYSGDPDILSNTANHNWRHDFSEIVGSLIAAGLQIEALGEHDTSDWPALPGIIEVGDGSYRLPDDAPRIPLTFSIVARKP